MADIDLTQAEADTLIAMEKHRCSEETWTFPMRWGIDLHSDSVHRWAGAVPARHERGRIDFSKVKMQNRGRQIVVLVRLDLGGPPHVHVYREGYGDKWAFPVPGDRFRDVGDVWKTLDDFFGYCNVTRPPHVKHGLFAC